MKILMVAIPNHHFFQWVNQLKDSGYEVFWLDVTDGGPKSDKIDWVIQIKGWKLKWNFPMRSRLKKSVPKLYKNIQKINEQSIEVAFNTVLNSIKPDIVHCFEMQLAGLPILPVMQENKVPFIYSSWGSDLFYFEKKGLSKKEVKTFFSRTNYLITDCKRDYVIAKNNGFVNEYLGVFPGNGGLEVDTKYILKTELRDIIIIKGYQFDVGEAIQIVKALETVDKNLLEAIKIVIYSADEEVEQYVKSSIIFKNNKCEIYPRHVHVKNSKLLRFMGKSILHIANNTSDGMPNALLEAMGMGAFPIQSNPGGATEEVIVDNKNGFLINNPFDYLNIANLIERALIDTELRKAAQNYNIEYIKKNYKRSDLQSKIVEVYKNITHLLN